MLRGEQIPFVLLGRCASNQGLSFVDVDIEAGVAESLATLSAMGHRTIAYLPFVDDEDFGFAERTLTGFAAACQRHELVSTILPCHPTASGGEAALEHLLGAGALPTALLVRNVTIAEGILRAANRHHLNCPADFSMVVMGSAEERKLAMPTAPLLTVIDIRPDILAMTATQFPAESIWMADRKAPSNCLCHPSFCRVTVAALFPLSDLFCCSGGWFCVST